VFVIVSWFSSRLLSLVKRIMLTLHVDVGASSAMVAFVLLSKGIVVFIAF